MLFKSQTTDKYIQYIKDSYGVSEDYTILYNNNLWLENRSLDINLSFIDMTYSLSTLILVGTYFKLSALAKQYSFFNCSVNFKIPLTSQYKDTYIVSEGYFNESTVILQQLNIVVPKSNLRSNLDLCKFIEVTDEIINLVMQYKYKERSAFWLHLMNLFEPIIKFNKVDSNAQIPIRIPIILVYRDVDCLISDTDIIVGSTLNFISKISNVENYYKVSVLEREKFNKYDVATIYKPNILFLTLGNDTYLIYWYIGSEDKDNMKLILDILKSNGNIYTEASSQEFLENKVDQVLTHFIIIDSAYTHIIVNGIIDTAKLSSILVLDRPLNFKKELENTKKYIELVYNYNSK